MWNGILIPHGMELYHDASPDFESVPAFDLTQELNMLASATEKTRDLLKDSSRETATEECKIRSVSCYSTGTGASLVLQYC